MKRFAFNKESRVDRQLQVREILTYDKVYSILFFPFVYPAFNMNMFLSIFKNSRKEPLLKYLVI